jgi:broad specificity phosphatase PhoE
MSDQSKTLKRVYFIRHGESLDNIAPVFQSVNAKLSQEGREQAKKLTERMSRVSFEALITSPLPRASETAQFISQATGKTTETSDLFVERIKPTSIDGKLWSDHEASTVWREWEESLYTPGMKAQNGENYEEIFKRAKNALTYLENRSETSMAVVTHGYFLRTIIANVIMGENVTGPLFKNFQMVASIQNTGITILEYRNAFEEEYCWRLWSYNDYSHLTESF